MNVLSWVLVAYLAGALALVMLDDLRNWHWDELAALAAWPVWMPVGFVRHRIKRHRRTCSTCGRRYGNRGVMLKHRATCSVAEPVLSVSAGDET